MKKKNKSAKKYDSPMGPLVTSGGVGGRGYVGVEGLTFTPIRKGKASKKATKRRRLY